MKFLLLTTSLILTVSGIDDTEWTRYKETHNKVYTTEYENVRRLEQYLKNRQMVKEHNRRYRKGETSYKMAVNKFSDWFPEEIRKLTVPYPVGSGPRGRKFEPANGSTVPESINWVKKGAVTGVKDQGHCSSSYAFSSAGALEGLMFRANNTITNLSAQELLDCTLNAGCDRGTASLCFYYVMNRNGISTDASYPYEHFQGKCRANRGQKGASCNAFAVLVKESSLMDAVGTVGPVSVIFGADNSFIHYKSGVFDGSCSTDPNHAMLAVGYDAVYKKEKNYYWLMKNSWGVQWGENGYARVARGKNKCGLADFGSFPFYL